MEQLELFPDAWTQGLGTGTITGSQAAAMQNAAYNAMIQNAHPVSVSISNAHRTDTSFAQTGRVL